MIILIDMLCKQLYVGGNFHLQRDTLILLDSGHEDVVRKSYLISSLGMYTIGLNVSILAQSVRVMQHILEYTKCFA